MWFKNEIDRDPLFCDFHLVVSKECWQLDTQPHTDGLFRALTYLDKFSLFLPSGYSEVWAKPIKTELIISNNFNSVCRAGLSDLLTNVTYEYVRQNFRN